MLQTDVVDEKGNLRAADIGITWENNETFLHGVRIVGPGPPRQTGMGPAMSTTYQPMGERNRDSTPPAVRPPTPETAEVTSDMDTPIRRPSPEIRQGHRPAAPIQRFNNKSLVVSTFSGCRRCPRMEQGPKSTTTGVLSGRDRHERSPGVGGCRLVQL